MSSQEKNKKIRSNGHADSEQTKRSLLAIREAEIRSWEGISIIFFFSGFVLALIFSAFSDLSQIIGVEGAVSQVTNTVGLGYEDDKGKKIGSVSDTVAVPVKESPSIDVVPPEVVKGISVTNVSSSSLTISWPAPGDVNELGNTVGTVAYDIRYATFVIADENDWGKATQVQKEPSPGAPGFQEVMTVTGLSENTDYWVGIKSSDKAGNVSGLSGVVKTNTKTTDENPVPVTELKLRVETEEKIKQFSEVVVEVFDGTTSVLIEKLVSNSDEAGVVMLAPTKVQQGIYTIIVTIPGYLAKKVPGFDTSKGLEVGMTGLLGGDLTDDDAVNSLDWAVMSSSWGKSDEKPDFNRDKIVNSLDFGVMNKNWGGTGDK